jgi:hypothetical protein
VGNVNLSLLTQRDPYWVFYGASSDQTSNISERLYFPTGTYDVLGADLLLTPIGGEAVAIENHPGVLRLNTNGANPNGNVTWKYGAHYYDTGFSHTFRAELQLRLEPGDYMQYFNTDLETGSTMDVHYYIYVQQLR